MRYFLLALLMAGCYVPYPEGSPVSYTGEEPSIAPIQRASGNANDIFWACSQDDVNDYHVWITCSFENLGSYRNDVCINIQYTHRGPCTESNPSGLEIVYNPRRVCSGSLNPGDTHEGYVSFYEQNPDVPVNPLPIEGYTINNGPGFDKLVNVCGRTMSFCKMEAVVEHSQ